MIHLWKHKYQPSYMLDLYGFEVKRFEGCDLTSVHETLAHTRLVNYAYLVWNCPDDTLSKNLFSSIKENCAAYGLGLITFADKDSGDSFHRHLEAKRCEPTAAAVDDFIETRFPDDQRNLLLEWLGATG